jgi:hypothetical protein
MSADATGCLIDRTKRSARGTGSAIVAAEGAAISIACRRGLADIGAFTSRTEPEDDLDDTRSPGTRTVTNVPKSTDLCLAACQDTSRISGGMDAEI